MTGRAEAGEPEEDSSWPDAPPQAEYAQVGLAHTVCVDAELARQCFARFSALNFGHLLTSELLSVALSMSGSATFSAEKSAPGFREVESTPQRVGRMLNMALSRPVLLRWLEQVTGCEPLEKIEGRLTQTLCRPGDQLTWHDDTPSSEGRQLAVVLCLGTEEYSGGEFQMRRKSGELLFEHHYARPGSALLFRVDPRLEHRVLPLRSGGPRRVYAGWALVKMPAGGSR